MAELVDAQVSGTCDRFGRGSSSLLQGTITQNPPLRRVLSYNKPHYSLFVQYKILFSQQKASLGRGGFF